LDYLEKLYKLNQNDWLLALASYNAGLGNVYKAQRQYRKRHKHQANIEDYQPNFWEIQSYLPKETQGYVPKLLAVAHIVEYAERFQVDLEPIDNQPYFSIITLDKQVSLNQVAQVSKTPMALLATLNPGYHQPATPPNGTYHLLLPADRAAQFQETLQTDKSLFTIQWQRHKIKAGDSLSGIAYRYKTSSQAIKKLNGMKNANIRAGKTLLIPVPLNQTVVASVKPTNNKSISSSIKNTVKTTQTINQQTANKHVHTVKSGDSLWQLAKEYHTSSKEIAQWNSLSLNSPLKLGQKLVIYGQTPNRNQTTKMEHTLQPGENLWLLAKRYNVTTRDIAKWNALPTNKVLKPGLKLIIWSKNSQPLITKYIVKNGDNLWDIAKANQLSASQLAKFNKLSLSTLLQPGQVLHIPKGQEVQES
ncbi:MAG: LysM peptidoglycan-binding domain-containing protein, partial [Thiomicrorhabdus sp.]|nr:LysM peptidoglycan-binding domain-containing protein [Thiomicrorhabdus sp.]